VLVLCSADVSGKISRKQMAVRRCNQGIRKAILHQPNVVSYVGGGSSLMTSARYASEAPSAHARGLSFELAAVALLQSHGMTVRRCGGASDEGIDLIGWWDLPQQPRLPLIGQCKRHTKSASTAQLRDFEHAMANTSLHKSLPEVAPSPAALLGVFVSHAGFSSLAIR
jgi:hypothetical protein